jgi:hypothetical protein
VHESTLFVGVSLQFVFAMIDGVLKIAIVFGVWALSSMEHTGGVASYKRKVP